MRSITRNIIFFAVLFLVLTGSIIYAVETRNQTVTLTNEEIKALEAKGIKEAIRTPLTCADKICSVRVMNGDVVLFQVKVSRYYYENNDLSNPIPFGEKELNDKVDKLITDKFKQIAGTGGTKGGAVDIDAGGTITFEEGKE